MDKIKLKKLTSILLSILITVSFMPAFAFAEAEEVSTENTSATAETQTETEEATEETVEEATVKEELNAEPEEKPVVEEEAESDFEEESVTEKEAGLNSNDETEVVEESTIEEAPEEVRAEADGTVNENTSSEPAIELTEDETENQALTEVPEGNQAPKREIENAKAGTYSGVIVESGTCGTNVNYDVYRIDAENYTLVISGNGAMDDNKSSLWSSYNPKTLYVEDGVYHIGAYSFNGFNDIHLSDGISSIGKYAFQNCTFDSLHLPENLLTLGEGAFSEGYISGELVIPEGVTSIPKKAFKPYSAFQTQKITSITLPSTLVSIGDYAFQYAAIKELTLPDSVRSLGYQSFGNCEMEKLTLSKNLKEVAEEAFFGCSKLKNITIPNGVETIGKSAFAGCGSDSYRFDIEIPASVKEIRDAALTGYFKNIYFYGDQPIFGAYPITASMGHYLADNVTWNASTLPDSVKWKTWYNLESCNISYDEIVEYTGSYIKPTVTITCAGQELEFGTQYTLRYANNKEMGTADIEISGMGECKGQVTKHFDITKKIENCEITIDDQVFFTGEEVTPNYTVTDGDKTLVEGQDYSVSFNNNIALGTATATFRGEGYYTDTTEKNFEIVEKDHVWNEGEETKPATCTEDGVKTFTCKGCGVTRTEVIEALGHTEEVLPAKAVTCTESGLTEGKKCSVCGEILEAQKEIPALGHDYQEVKDTAIEVTCTTDGKEADQKCSRCGKEINGNIIPMTGHTEKILPGKAATCTEPGLTEGKKCSVCGEILEAQETIPATGHDLYTIRCVVDPSCVREGYYEMGCRNCGEIFNKTVPRTDHPWNSGSITTEPTCTEDGVMTYKCVTCAVEKTETIPALGHSWNTSFTVDTKPTCTAKGSKSKHCSKCGAKSEVTAIAATGHSWDSGVITTKATCTKAGVKTFTCKTCKTKKTSSIAATGHSWNSSYTVDTKATCTKTGSKSIHCSKCNTKKSGSAKSIAMIAHKYSAWTTTKAATEIAAGTQSHKCSACGKTETKTIKQLAPTLPAVSIAKPKAAKKSATVKWKKVSKKNQKKIGSIQIQYSTDKTFKTGVKTVTASKKAKSRKITKLTSKKTYYVRLRAYIKTGGKVHVSKWSTIKAVKAK